MVGAAGFRPQIIRSKQRVVTAISPHNGCDQFLIPKRMDGDGGPGPGGNPQGVIYQQGTLTLGTAFAWYGYYPAYGMGAQAGFTGLDYLYCDGASDRFYLRMGGGAEVVNETIYLEDSTAPGVRKQMVWNGSTDYTVLDQPRRMAWEQKFLSSDKTLAVTLWTGPAANTGADFLGRMTVGTWSAIPELRYGWDTSGPYGAMESDVQLLRLYWDSQNGSPYKMVLAPPSQFPGINSIYYTDDTMAGRNTLTWESGMGAYTKNDTVATYYNAWKAKLGQAVNFHAWNVNLVLA